MISHVEKKKRITTYQLPVLCWMLSHVLSHLIHKRMCFVSQGSYMQKNSVLLWLFHNVYD